MLRGLTASLYKQTCLLQWISIIPHPSPLQHKYLVIESRLKVLWMPFKIPLLLGEREMCNGVTTMPIIYMLIVLHGLEPSVDLKNMWRVPIYFILGESCKLACITTKGIMLHHRNLFSFCAFKGSMLLLKLFEFQGWKRKLLNLWFFALFFCIVQTAWHGSSSMWPGVSLWQHRIWSSGR